MAVQGEFSVRYWGVTGSLASPLPPEEIERKLTQSICRLSEDPEFRRRVADQQVDPTWLSQRIQQLVPFAWRSTFGGNTTCIEVQTPDALVIIDSGSGFRRLGEELARRWDQPDYRGDRTAHVLLTHAHMDHTFATPFVEPYYDDRSNFTIWAPRRVLESLDAVLSPTSSLRSIYFPPTYDALEGIKQFREIQAGETFQLGGIRVETFGLNHPGEALAFRLDGRSSSIVIASDHEQTAVPDQALAEFARDADVLYSDAQYLRAEYEGRSSIADEPPTRRVGWGHSHMEGAVETAVAARVGSLHLGHHDPKRDDIHLARMELLAQAEARKLLATYGRDVHSMTVHLAREGETFCLS